MRKYIRTGIAVVLSISYLIFLSLSLNVGDSRLPPLGNFLNPYTGFAKNAEPTKKWPSLVKNVKGMKTSALIIVDKKSVPHIKADHIEDVYFGQGYMHAKHRLWQMDFTYRAVSGNVSDVIGKVAVNYDIGQRLKGHDIAVEKRLKAWESCEESSKLMEAYVAGVNSYINHLKARDYPLEFKLMNYKPKKWTIEKSMYVYIGMCADLAHGDNDIAYSHIRAAVGDSTFHDMFKDYYFRQEPIVPDPITVRLKSTAQYNHDPLDGTVGLIEKEKIIKGVGSNNWAISGSKSATGLPILASDPHLSLRLPSIWYENQLAGPDFNAYGVSVPGLPSVVIGFNQYIAWGMTNFGHDFRDWYKVDWVNDKKENYYINGKTAKIKSRKQKIKIANAPDTSIVIKYTELGPIRESTDGTIDYSFHWLLFDDVDNCDLAFFTEINRSKSFDDYYKATKNFLFPPQNIAFASLQGDIALRAQGRFPIRDQGQGKMVESMDDVNRQWKGFVSHDELPMIHNPERDYVFSANQHTTSPDYPYYYTGVFEGFRSRRINEVLANANKVNVEDMKALQLDIYNVKASDLAPIFIHQMERIKLSEDQLDFLDRLSNWKYEYQANSEETTFFELWYDQARRLTYDEILNLASSAHVLPEDWQFAELIENQPTSAIFDIKKTEETEFAAEIINQAFVLAWKQYNDLAKEKHYWSDHKNVRVNHMANISAFSHEGLKVGGNGNTVNATTDTHGPSWRMVVSLGEKIDAYGVYPGGQDGNPGSVFFDNMIPLWENGDYYKLDYLTSWEEEPDSRLYSIKLSLKE